ncbi:tRNA (guanine-N(7)-)-methyltransferase non-catalytic subunit TRM82 [Leucoagaricus sp. SymC.cos]|nr:tRNA (guanine-N(7)-)-methyltransferase non-catalytic subunit TRM82 [Leucoagaricus sp. SymC.cos]
MTATPYTRLFVGTERTVAVSGSHIYVLNSTTGETISHKSTVSQDQGKAASKGPIVTAAVNEDSTYLLTVGESKMMGLWRLPELELLNERELPKRPTGLAFMKDSQTIVVSDKFGDVFSYPFNHVPPKIMLAHDDFSSHENPSGGQLVLGHASPLNAFLLSHDEKYIITADRDEHIRISRYPQGYNIQMYCLGHRKYVSAIHIPSFAADTLISGGGDPTLKIWNWMSGQCTGEVQIWETVEPFVLVKNNKRKYGDDDEDDEGDAAQKRKGKGKKSKKRAAKRAAAQAQKADEAQGEGDEKPAKEIEEKVEDEEPQPLEEKVLVVSKIDSLEKGDRKFVVFSAVGITALFAFSYPTGPVEHIDFGHPIIDFAPDKEARIWVSLDLSRSAPGAEPSKERVAVRVVQFGEDGKLVEGSSSTDLTLLKSLNTTAERDTKEKTLNFYADLKGMPKWSEPGSTQAASAEPEDDATESVSESTISKPLTRREEARMKNKKNVLAKMQQAQGEQTGDKRKPGTVRPLEDVESSDVEGREPKRVKSAAKTTIEDVEM